MTTTNIHNILLNYPTYTIFKNNFSYDYLYQISIASNLNTNYILRSILINYLLNYPIHKKFNNSFSYNYLYQTLIKKKCKYKLCIKIMSIKSKLCKQY